MTGHCELLIFTLRFLLIAAFCCSDVHAELQHELLMLMLNVIRLILYTDYASFRSKSTQLNHKQGHKWKSAAFDQRHQTAFKKCAKSIAKESTFNATQ
jgi:hypothetical protein